MSLRLRGHGASRGNALGRARVRQSHMLEIAEQRVPANQVETQLQRLHVAIEAARTEMQQLRDRLHGALARGSANSSSCMHCCSTTLSCCKVWTS